MRGGEGVREGGHTEIEVVNMSQNGLYVKVWKNNICVCECVCVRGWGCARCMFVFAKYD